MQYAKRRERLRAILRQSGLSSLLVTSVHNVSYLTGFSGDSSYLLVERHGEVMLTDSRYETQLDEECPGLKYESRTSAVSMVQLLTRVLGAKKLSVCGIEADSMTKGQFDQLSASVSGVEWVSTSGLVEGLRRIKDKDELAEIRRSIHLAERAFEAVRAGLTLEQTELAVAAELEHRIRGFGGVGCAFAPIVGVGPRAALPHAMPSERRIEESPFVLIDWGAKAGRYLSDLTRVLVTGRLSPKLVRVYEVVLRAQLAAIAEIRPGVRASQVDGAARRVIEEAGHGRHFGHGLGHGFGLQIHEDPRMSATNEMVLEPGMVVTVEPGIYLPGWGGVRIEDDVLVTSEGREVLTSLPKRLEECVVNL